MKWNRQKYIQPFCGNKKWEKPFPFFFLFNILYFFNLLENCKNLIRNDASAVLLIKPQFEADRADIEKGGVVKDEKVRKKIIKDIENFCSTIGFKTLGIIESPIQGAKSKNTEYLIYLKREN